MTVWAKWPHNCLYMDTMQMIGTPISGFYSLVTVDMMVDCIDSRHQLNLEFGGWRMEEESVRSHFSAPIFSCPLKVLENVHNVTGKLQVKKNRHFRIREE